MAASRPNRPKEAIRAIGTDNYITDRTTHRSARSIRRLPRYRTGCEGRITHLKRAYGAGRPQL